MRVARRLGVIVAVLVCLAAVGLGGLALGRRTLDTHPVEPERAAPLTVMAEMGSVEDIRDVEVSLQWEVADGILNRLPGTITWTSLQPGVASEVAAGDVLYSVDETRVVVMAGSVPAFRDIGLGAEGIDVRQVEQFLAEHGYPTGDVDGKWTSETTTAYRAFRKDRLLPEASGIRLGEVAFLPELPATVALAQGREVGAIIADGEVVLRVLSGPPRGTYFASPGSATTPTGAAVTVTIGAEEVSGSTAGTGVRTDDGRVAIPVVFETISGECEWCAAVPADEVTTWSAKLEVVPRTDGVTLPVGAIRTAANGGPAVLLVGGEVVAVSIV